MSYKLMYRSFLAAICSLMRVTTALAKQPANLDGSDFTAITEMSLKELMDISVYSVSRKLKKISESSSAVYVITQIELALFYNLPFGFEFDTALYYVDEIHGIKIPYYTRLALRVGWRKNDSLEISLVGQNLLEEKHQEYEEKLQIAHLKSQEAYMVKLHGNFKNKRWNRATESILAGCLC